MAVSYSEPLCKKCLHLESLHSEVVATLPGGKVKRCTVSICPCLLVTK
ncbi:MAG TPA: hypothetical protein VJP79_02090 [Nitrososphaera sp.]|nr:hypothetical protein [Nitrososphaera sp.]